MAGLKQTDETRREVLEAIRRHLASSAPHDEARKEHRAPHETAVHEPGARAVEQDPSIPAAERFRESLEAVAGHCAIVRGEAEAAEVLGQIIGRKEARRVAVSDSALVRRVVGAARTEAELIENAPAHELFDCDVGVTGAQWAVAETGTLVLESDLERHRLSSLVPPVHVAIVGAGRVRQTLYEVLRSINESGRDGLSRAVTLITGPSRTSDIELTLAIGVHGPAELYVIVIDGEGDG